MDSYTSKFSSTSGWHMRLAPAHSTEVKAIKFRYASTLVCLRGAAMSPQTGSCQHLLGNDGRGMGQLLYLHTNSYTLVTCIHAREEQNSASEYRIINQFNCVYINCRDQAHRLCLWKLRFSPRQLWKLLSSCMWRHKVWSMFTDI